MWQVWHVIPCLAYLERFHSPYVSLIGTPRWFLYEWQPPQYSDVWM